MENEKQNEQPALPSQVHIALIQKDMTYVREDLKKINEKMSDIDKNFVRKDEHSAHLELTKALTAELKNKVDHADLKETMQKMNIDIDKKVSREEFKPIQSTLNKVNWLMITAVVVGLLSLIIKAGS